MISFQVWLENCQGFHILERDGMFIFQFCMLSECWHHLRSSGVGIISSQVFVRSASRLSVACLLKMQDNHLAVHYSSPV